MNLELDDEHQQKDQARHRSKDQPRGVRGCNCCHKCFPPFWILLQRPSPQTDVWFLKTPEICIRKSNIRFWFWRNLPQAVQRNDAVQFLLSDEIGGERYSI